MEWLGYSIVLEIGFYSNPTKTLLSPYYDDPQFWTQSNIHWSTNSDNSGSFEVRYEMECLVYCIVLAIGFHSKPTKRLIPPHYAVPHVLDLIRYRLVHEIGQFRFVRSSF
ncbi:unnamed protein product [Prunus brigantina]